MDPALWELLRAAEEVDAPRPVEAIIRLTGADVEVPGVRLVARFGPIATCRIDPDDVVAVRAHRGVVSLKAARPMGAGRVGEVGANRNRSDPGSTPDPDAATERGDPTALLPSDLRRPPGLEPTGAGVVVGSIDWGLDVDCTAFRHPPTPGTTDRAGGTRLLALWDQRDQQAAPSRAPQPYGYGVVHDRAAIDRALVGGRPYDDLLLHPAVADQGRGAHGTHVFDIAAGSGIVGPQGIAPDADLIFVHLADRDTGGLANLGDSVRLLEALDFIVRTVGSRPCVVNTSIGRHGGPHDGCTLAELAIDRLLATRPGFMVVKSTGNYYGSRTHASGTLAAGEVRALRFTVHPEDVTPNELEVWYGGAQEFAVRLIPPGAPPGRWLLPDERADITVARRVVGRAYHRADDPNNGGNHIDVFLDPAACAGEWTVELEGRRVRSGRFDAWLERDDTCQGCQARFRPEDSDRARTTGTLANGHLDLTVGAYDARDPARPPAPFSSAGPTRDGRAKPDVAAPGVAILAARSAPAGATYNRGLLVRKSGTSMAAPHVTGAVALCLQLGLEAGRVLTACEIRDLVMGSCDPAPPGSRLRLGRGYLDIPRLLRATRAALACHHLREPAMDRASARYLASARDELLVTEPVAANRALLQHPGGTARTLRRGDPDPGWFGAGDGEDAPAGDLDRLIDQGLSENQITNSLFYERNPRLMGQRLRSGTAEARQWTAIRDGQVRPGLLARVRPARVDPVDLAVFLSQYENDSRVPAEITERFLSGPPLLSLGRSLRDRVLGHWLAGGAPLTTTDFFQLAVELSGDAGTAAVLCHNVTKAFVREGVAITWRGTGTEGEYTDGQKTYRAKRINRAGRLTYRHPVKNKDVVSIFYLLFSEREFGVEDPGDWYHFFVTATMTALASGGSLGTSRARTRREDVEQDGEDRGDRVNNAAYRELLATQLVDLEKALTDPALAAVPGYRGWVLANALSFLEGGHYGADFTTGQSDVARESRVHVRGAAFGLAAIGGRPGSSWSWRVPLAGSLSKADLLTGYSVQDKTWQVWGPDGKPRAGSAKKSGESFGFGDDAPAGGPSGAGAPARVPEHVRRARAWWATEFGADPTLGQVVILDYAAVPSEPVRRFGYAAWTNSATRIYVAPAAAVDAVTLERVLRHEAVHVRQFAATGRPQTYEEMLRDERAAYSDDVGRLDARARELRQLTKDLRSVEKQLGATATTVGRLDAALAAGQRVGSPAAREARFRRFLRGQDLIPEHRRIEDLYEPPAAVRNPSAQEQLGWGGAGDAGEQAVAMPRVVAIRFRTAGNSDADNGCAICPVPLGVASGGTACNGMELRFRIEGDRPGMEYDVVRTRRDSLWQRVGGVWARLGVNAMGTNDDHHDDDEALRLRDGFIYVVDRPGFPGLALPAPAQALGGGTLWPGVTTSAAAQDVVLRYSFAEWVLARNRSDGTPWTRLELPALSDGTQRRFVYWRCVVWLTRNGAGNFVMDARSRIERGAFSAATLSAAPA